MCFLIMVGFSLKVEGTPFSGDVYLPLLTERKSAGKY